MSNTIKLKVCVGDTNIELEGDGDLVHTIFSELRESGLGQLSSSILVRRKTEPKEADSVGVPVSEETNEKPTDRQGQLKASALPNIETIVIKDLPKTEAEWILVYALYASAQGIKGFTESDLRQVYQDSNRWNESRRKNFAANIKKAVTSDWFEIVDDSNYSLLNAGKDKAYEIIQRATNSNSSKKKATNSAKATLNVLDLGLDEGKRQEIKQHLLSFKALNNIDKAVVIAYKLAQYGVAELDENTIFTALRIAELPASYDLRSSLTNGKKKSYFISSDTAGMYKLHHLGEDRAKELEKARDTE